MLCKIEESALLYTRIEQSVGQPLKALDLLILNQQL
jgi:hypothetical protein